MPHQQWTRKSFLRGMAAVGAAPFLPGLIPASAHAAASDRPGFPLAAGGTAVGIFVDAADDPAVVRAAGDLRSDVERVSGARPDLLRTLPRSAPCSSWWAPSARAPPSTASSRRAAWTSPG